MKRKITLVRSTIGIIPKHRRAIKSLGLYKLNQSRELSFTPALKGAINNVAYLLKIEEVK